ncbi:MAG: tetratricopeptide repeat protein [Chloroflexi bacterium]|nr:tetratricopeptide repeat protein [Chloroflexota bacterium]
MSVSGTLTAVTAFGDLLRQLRRRAGMTQGELAALVGFSVAQISRLEQNERLPDLAIIVEKFVPALALQEEPHLAQRLLELAARARGERPPAAVNVTREVRTVIREEVLEMDARLPTPPTTLIGREREIALIAKRLLAAPGRLLTLIGPPGVGKTRLGLAVAAQLQNLFADGVHFIALAALNDPDLLASGLLTGLLLTENNSKPPRLRLLEFLRRRELLIVLDNFEHLTQAAPLLAELLEQCAGLRLLVTSREPLHLRAEQRFKVQPLEPATAVELFIQRAQAIEPDFVWTTENLAPITEICLRLDCLPLAIELVAVRIDLWSPHKLLEQLQARRLDLFADGAPRDLTARHQTLRAAIDWSYQLLTRQEQQALASLSVFAGGWIGEAAWSVGEVTLPILKTLVNQSLLKVATQADGEARFHLLETIHAFAFEQLEQQGEDARLQDRHAAYFLGLALAAEAPMPGPEKKRWFDRLESELDNLRAAYKWLVAVDPAGALRLAGALKEFWYLRGYFNEGRQWLTQALAREPAPSAARALALLAAGQLAQNQGDYTVALPLIEESIALYRQLDDLPGVAEALRECGWVVYNMHLPQRTIDLFEESLQLFRALDDKAKIANLLISVVYARGPQAMGYAQVDAYLSESLALLREVGQVDGIIYALHTQGTVAIEFGHYATAITLLTEGLTLARTFDTKHALATVLMGLGEAVRYQGDGQSAQQHFHEAYQLFQQFGDKDGVMITLHHLGQVEHDQGHEQAATAYFVQSLTLCQELGNKHMTARCLAGLGSVALAYAQLARAASLLAAAQRILDTLPPFLAPADLEELVQVVANIRAACGEADFTAAWAQGVAMTTEQAVAYALATGM